MAEAYLDAADVASATEEAERALALDPTNVTAIAVRQRLAPR